MKKVHTIPPIYSKDSKILILGSFPSVKSREAQFFYHHPQNRFWKVISEITNSELPKTIEDKKDLLLKNNIALWDVVESCEITGSSDSSIKNVTANDIERILKETDISMIFTNGKKSESLYNKFCKSKTGKEAICLPSTSPANANCNIKTLILAWSVIKDYLF